MILRTETEMMRRERHRTPHRIFVLFKRLGGDDADAHDVVVLCRRIWRRWNTGYEYDIGDGVWRSGYHAYP
jgi:hypothetical protein